MHNGALGDPHPGQAAPLGRNEITHARQRFFAFQVGLARDKPFGARNDPCWHGA